MPNRREITAEKHLTASDAEQGLPVGEGSDITLSPSLHSSQNNWFRSGYPLGTGGRLLLALLGLFLLAGFGLSGWFTPAPRGYGTHQQLGLAPCTFLMLTGKPCPSCGGTTAFAHFVRGQWPSAVRANAAAFVLAISCAVLMPWSWLSAAQGRMVGIVNYEKALLMFVLTMSALFALQWGVRLLGG